MTLEEALELLSMNLAAAKKCGDLNVLVPTEALDLALAELKRLNDPAVMRARLACPRCCGHGRLLKMRGEGSYPCPSCS
jgi:hypothetical protein